MKIRIKGDSIRLRLTRPEVASLIDGRPIVEATHLPGATLHFELRVRRDGRAHGIGRPGPGAIALDRADVAGPVAVTFDAHRLCVTIDADLAEGFADPDRVGIAHDVPTAGGRALSVRIEKDFACLDRPDEPEPDAFPNPNACSFA